MLQSDCFYQMSNLSQIQSYKLEGKPSAAKMIMARRRHSKVLTEDSSTISEQKCEKSQSRNLLFPLMQRLKDFPSIFMKHRRNQYSGYKQINLNKGRNMKIHQQNRETMRYSTPRKYQINIKSIAKLRKRYSLQPICLKQYQKEYQKMFMATSKSAQKQLDTKIEDINSERKYHQELREIIRLMNTNKHASSQKTFINESKITDCFDKIPQNLLLFSRHSPEQKYDSLSNIGEQIQQIKNIPQKFISNKPYYVQIKKRVENKMQNASRQPKLSEKEKFIPLEQQNDLCGWSTQSFYPKKRGNFFQYAPIEKMRLVK